MRGIEIQLKEIDWEDLTRAEQERMSTAQKELARYIGEKIFEALKNECTFENSDFTESEEKQI